MIAKKIAKEKTIKEGLIIGVDLDGVCSDFLSRMREIAAEWFECKKVKLTKNVSYGLHEWGIKDEEDYKDLHRFAVTQRDLFGTMKIIPGARKFLRILSNKGYRIRIITHRLFISHFHEKAVKQTVEWLDRNAIPYWDLCFMKEKGQVGADIYIEDTPKNIEALRAENHYTICFANSTNTNISDPRAKNWEDVYKYIVRYKKQLSS
jgi:5'(3')-deoxyribonucleotidase